MVFFTLTQKMASECSHEHDNIYIITETARGTLTVTLLTPHNNWPSVCPPASLRGRTVTSRSTCSLSPSLCLSLPVLCVYSMDSTTMDSFLHSTRCQPAFLDSLSKENNKSKCDLTVHRHVKVQVLHLL